jgi:hypothetical protein
VTRAAFNRAWEERPRRLPASRAQRLRIAELARLAEMETPRVFWSSDAEKVIKRLESTVREPTLGAM